MGSRHLFKQDSNFTHYKTFLKYCIIITFAFIHGQTTYQISGTVVDKNGENIRGARLNLYLSNKLLIKEEKTGRKGNFEFDKLKPDKYTLNIYG